MVYSRAARCEAATATSQFDLPIPVSHTRSSMRDERTDARNGGRQTGDRLPPRRVRLAWRWKASGTTGRGPWMYRSEIVEAWKETLNRRYQNTIEHWIEETNDIAPDASP